MPVPYIPSVPDTSDAKLVARAVRAIRASLEELLLGLDSDNILSLQGTRIEAGTLPLTAIGQVFSGVTHGTANTEFAVPHTLGRIPSGYVVTKNGNGGVVYNGTSVWTATDIYLRCTSSGNPVTILIL